MAEKYRPDRVELFCFYYLGFNPDGEYRFANVHHVSKYYNVSADAVLRWLEELDLQPSWVLRQHYDLAGVSVELMLEATNLTPMAIRGHAAAALAELDEADSGRKPWEDKPY